MAQSQLCIELFGTMRAACQKRRQRAIALAVVRHDRRRDASTNPNKEKQTAGPPLVHNVEGEGLLREYEQYGSVSLSREVWLATETTLQRFHKMTM